MNQDWKIEIDGKVFELDRNSEEHQAVYKFLNAESYKEKLQIWIDNFALECNEKGFYKFMPGRHTVSYWKWLDVIPETMREYHILRLAILQEGRKNYKIGLNLLGNYHQPEELPSRFDFYNDRYVSFVETMMMDDYEAIKKLLIREQYILTYEMMKYDIEGRSTITPLPPKEFFQNELEIIKDIISRINRDDHPVNGNPSDAFYLYLNGKYLCPARWHQEDFKFQNLVDDELRKIKAGIPFKPSYDKINYSYTNSWMSPFYFSKIILAYQYAQIIFQLEQWIKNPPEKEALSGKSEGLKSFRWIKNSEKELPLLYEKMKGNLISPETTLEQFTAIFTRRPIEEVNPVEWIEKPILLAYFIVEIVDYEKSNKVRCYGSEWKIAENCFFHSNYGMKGKSLQTSINRALASDSFPPVGHEKIDKLFQK